MTSQPGEEERALLLGKWEIDFSSSLPWALDGCEFRVTCYKARRSVWGGVVACRGAPTLMFLPCPRYRLFCSWALRALGLHGHPSEMN